MVAPTPVSALLHAVAVVKVGVFSIVRVLTGIFGVDLLGAFNLGTLVMVIASITILLSSCIALSQDELKRRLAFSTISQLSYIIFGVAMLSSMGQLGGVIHILMHAFGKITLFFCAGAIFVATGKKYISQMKGLGRQMPVTFGAFFYRLFRGDRPAAHRGVLQQMESDFGNSGGRSHGFYDRSADLIVSECVLFSAHCVSGIFRQSG